MHGTGLSIKWYFTIFGIMTMTKGIYDHGLTPSEIFAQGQHILIKKVLYFSKVYFFTFYRIIYYSDNKLILMTKTQKDFKKLIIMITFINILFCRGEILYDE
jgi:hypothetical protein